jgi:hypothetical protein
LKSWHEVVKCQNCEIPICNTANPNMSQKSELTQDSINETNCPCQVGIYCPTTYTWRSMTPMGVTGLQTFCLKTLWYGVCLIGQKN